MQKETSGLFEDGSKEKKTSELFNDGMMTSLGKSIPQTDNGKNYTKCCLKKYKRLPVFSSHKKNKKKK